MDINYPAVKQMTLLSTTDLQNIQEDPSCIAEYARAMGAVNLENLFRDLQSPLISPNSRIEFQKILNKMGGLEPKEDATPTGAQVVINITRAADTDGGITIEGGPLLEEDDA